VLNEKENFVFLNSFMSIIFPFTSTKIFPCFSPQKKFPKHVAKYCSTRFFKGRQQNPIEELNNN
jgi:hypothetical protein